MATQHDLAESFRRLVSGLSWLEEQPEGPERVKAIRTQLADHMTRVADGIANPKAKCRIHPGMPAHNCGPCRSERIGLEPGQAFNPAALPPTPADVTATEQRRLGEGDQQ